MLILVQKKSEYDQAHIFQDIFRKLSNTSPKNNV